MPNTPPVLVELSEELLYRLENRDNHETRFARKGLEARLLTQERLTALFEAYTDSTRAQDYASLTIKDGRSSRLKILATLLLRERSDDVERFLGWFRNDLSHYPSDANLPLTKERAQELFEGVCGSDFVNDQAIFLLYEYVEKKQLEIRKNEKQYYRHPIVGDPKRIGDGSFGVVEEIEIAKHHFIYANGALNSEPLRLARKVFREYNDTATSAEKNAMQEIEVLKKLDEGPSKHDNLMSSFGSVIEKDGDQVLEWTLLFPLATCNLGDALSGDYPNLLPPRNTREQKFALIEQFANLAHGLAHLHDQDISHLDIKPSNVLVVEAPSGSVWKLADYNLSVVRKRSWISRDTSSTSGKRPGGTFQAPEVQDIDTARVGWWSDLWSIGCMLIWVLAYLDDGPEGIKYFEKLRAEGGKSSDHTTQMDTFYVAPRGKTTADINPGVEEYCQWLQNRANERDASPYGEGFLVQQALKYVKDHPLILKAENRRSHKDGSREFCHKMRDIKEMYKLLANHNTAMLQSPGDEHHLSRSPMRHAATEPVTQGDTTSDRSDRESDAQTRQSRTQTHPSQSRGRSSETEFDHDHVHEARGNNISDSDSTSRTDQSSSPLSMECSGLCIAVEDFAGDTAPAQRLLDNGESPSELCAPCGDTPLHRAVRMDSVGSHLELLKVFLNDDLGADVECLDSFSRTPVEIALEDDNYSALDMLLDCLKRRESRVDWASLLDPESMRNYPRPVRDLLRARAPQA